MTKPAILKAIQKGRISATKDDKGQYQIDPAELFRVYKPLSVKEPPELSTGNGDEPHKGAELSAKIEAIEKENALLRDFHSRERRQLEGVIDDLRADRDHWRRQATALLTHQPDSAPEVRADAERTGFHLPPWVWLFVGAGVVAVTVTGAAFAWRHPEFFA